MPAYRRLPSFPAHFPSVNGRLRGFAGCRLSIRSGAFANASPLAIASGRPEPGQPALRYGIWRETCAQLRAGKLARKIASSLLSAGKLAGHGLYTGRVRSTASSPPYPVAILPLLPPAKTGNRNAWSKGAFPAHGSPIVRPPHRPSSPCFGEGDAMLLYPSQGDCPVSINRTAPPKQRKPIGLTAAGPPAVL